MRAGASEFFRAEHGDDEINERGEGDEADEDVFHGEAGESGRVGSADFPAEVGVGDGEGEERHGEGDEGEVGVHGPEYRTAAGLRLIKTGPRDVKKTSSPAAEIRTSLTLRDGPPTVASPHAPRCANFARSDRDR